MSRKPMASRRSSANTSFQWPFPEAGLGLAGFAILLILSAWLVGALRSPEPASVDDPIAQIESALVAEDLATAASISDEALAEEAPSPAEPERNWQVVTVQSGQNMDRIFRSLGLSAGLLHELIRLDDRTKQLVTIQPGDVFYFDIADDGTFVALKGELDEANWLLVEKDANDQLISRLDERVFEYRIVEASATIESSLFNAAKAADLSDNMTMKLANVFGWDIDFALDIRKGDRFSLLYEEVWRDGAFFKDGQILVARFINRGDVFEAIRFDAGDGPDYYDPEGRRMRKAFLRAPLNFTRVTSNFNPRRFHPVTQSIRPHNGTDYGAAPGTPVWSAGNGTVIESAYNRTNGHYVFVQHGNHIVTRYLHLSRRDVKKGDRVRQGQTIGTVGSTGLATGPHLHYEFLVNGTHRDPRKVDLPPADPLPGAHQLAFAEHTERLMTRLNRFEDQARLLASMGAERCESNAEAC